MKSIITVIALSLFLCSCTNPNVAVRVLSDQGYTNIQTKGYGWFECSEDDTFATRFIATNVNGKNVSGTVCSGLLKGATIRFDTH